MTEKTQYPAEEGLFVSSSDGPHLVGGLCRECETYFFPKFAEFHKPDCSGGPVDESLLSNRGELVSFTVQRFAPPPPFTAPEPFEPYAIGTVAIAEGLQIPGQITDCRIEDLTVGLHVELVLAPLFVDEDGAEALTWKFRPVATPADSGNANGGGRS